MEIQIVDWLQTPSLGKAIISFLVLVALSFVPFMPVSVVFGAIGFSYPLPLALCMNIGGTMIGAYLMFYLCKNGLRRFYERKIQYLKNDSKFIKLIQTNSFLAVLIARFIPILPSAIVNIICAMFQVPTRIYLIATLFGKLPSIFLYTIVGNQLLDNNKFVWLLLIIYLVILFYLTIKYRKRFEM
ncbi:MAG: VTT domain-containing protein [Lysinibacillus sp.]